MGRKAELIMSRSMPLGGDTQEEGEYNIGWGVRGFNHILGSDTLRIIPHLSPIRLATIKKTRVNKS